MEAAYTIIRYDYCLDNTCFVSFCTELLFLTSLFIPTFNSSDSYYLKLFNKLLCGIHIPVQTNYDVGIACSYQPLLNFFLKKMLCDCRYISYRVYLSNPTFSNPQHIDVL